MNRTATVLGLVLAYIMLGAASAQAANGTWTNTAGGTWGDSNNWAGGIIADGAGSTADFSTINLTADCTNTLDSSRTIGTLIFGDTVTASAAGWTLDNGGNTNYTLTVTNIVVNTLGTGKRATITAGMTGAGSLTKSGPGTVTLSGIGINYSGATVINDGRLVLAITNANNVPTFGSGTVTINTGAVLEFNTPTGEMFFPATTYTGAGTIVKTGVGNVKWGSAIGTFNLQAGSLIDVQAGLFDAGSFANEKWTNNVASMNVANNARLVEICIGGQAASLDALTGSGSIENNSIGNQLTLGVNNTAAGTYNTAGSATFSGTFKNAPNGITKTGTGIQILAGAGITYTGATVIVNGMLVFSNTVNNFSRITNNAALLFDTGGSVLTRTNYIAGAITGTVTKAGSGTLVLTAVNTYQGPTVISAGTLQVGDGVSDGSIASSGAITNLATLAFNTASSQSYGNSIVSTNNPVNGLVVKLGAGMLTLSGSNGYSGTTTISNGVLAVSNNLALSTNAVLLAGGGLGAAAGTWVITNVVNVQTASSLGATGTLALMGNVTNNGALTVVSGEVLFNGSKTGTGALTVSGGCLGGTGTVYGVVTNAGTITAADTNSVGTLTLTDLVMQNGSTCLVNFDSNSCDHITVTGTLTLPTPPNVATVNVSRISGTWAPNPAVLFSAPNISGTVGGLVIRGDVRPDAQLIIRNNLVQLVSPTGMMLMLD